MNDEMIDVSKQDLFKLLDSGAYCVSDKDSLIVDRDAFMKLHKMFQGRFGIHCGYIQEEELEGIPIVNYMVDNCLALTSNEARGCLWSANFKLNGKFLTPEQKEALFFVRVTSGDEISISGKTYIVE